MSESSTAILDKPTVPLPAPEPPTAPATNGHEPASTVPEATTSGSQSAPGKPEGYPVVITKPPNIFGGLMNRFRHKDQPAPQPTENPDDKSEYWKNLREASAERYDATVPTPDSSAKPGVVNGLYVEVPPTTPAPTPDSNLGKGPYPEVVKGTPIIGKAMNRLGGSNPWDFSEKPTPPAEVKKPETPTPAPTTEPKTDDATAAIMNKLDEQANGDANVTLLSSERKVTKAREKKVPSEDTAARKPRAERTEEQKAATRERLGTAARVEKSDDVPPGEVILRIDSDGKPYFQVNTNEKGVHARILPGKDPGEQYRASISMQAEGDDVPEGSKARERRLFSVSNVSELMNEAAPQAPEAVQQVAQEALLALDEDYGKTEEPPTEPGGYPVVITRPNFGLIDGLRSRFGKRKGQTETPAESDYWRRLREAGAERYQGTVMGDDESARPGTINGLGIEVPPTTPTPTPDSNLGKGPYPEVVKGTPIIGKAMDRLGGSNPWDFSEKPTPPPPPEPPPLAPTKLGEGPYPNVIAGTGLIGKIMDGTGAPTERAAATARVETDDRRDRRRLRLPKWVVPVAVGLGLMTALRSCDSTIAAPPTQGNSEPTPIVQKVEPQIGTPYFETRTPVPTSVVPSETPVPVETSTPTPEAPPTYVPQEQVRVDKGYFPWLIGREIANKNFPQLTEKQRNEFANIYSNAVLSANSKDGQDGPLSPHDSYYLAPNTILNAPSELVNQMIADTVRLGYVPTANASEDYQKFNTAIKFMTNGQLDKTRTVMSPEMQRTTEEFWNSVQGMTDTMNARITIVQNP